jgi:hypothetical protein
VLTLLLTTSCLSSISCPCGIIIRAISKRSRETQTLKTASDSVAKRKATDYIQCQETQLGGSPIVSSSRHQTTSLLNTLRLYRQATPGQFPAGLWIACHAEQSYSVALSSVKRVKLTVISARQFRFGGFGRTSIIKVSKLGRTFTQRLLPFCVVHVSE